MKASRVAIAVQIDERLVQFMLELLCDISCLYYNVLSHQELLLLTWFHFNPSMDK